MKTPSEILDSEFATQNIAGMVRDGVIKAMEEYAIQSVECAKDSIEKIKEDNPQISEAAAYEIQEAWEKVHALEDDLHNSETEKDKLRIQYDAEFEAFKMSFRNRSIKRLNMLEEWLTEYRDQLKNENVYHKNTGIINAINELLNETSTDI